MFYVLTLLFLYDVLLVIFNLLFYGVFLPGNSTYYTDIALSVFKFFTNSLNYYAFNIVAV